MQKRIDTTEVRLRTNYVLIDFENVQPENLDVFSADHFKVIVFVGASQTKVPFDVAIAMQKLGSRAEYVKISGNGPNALDFHIAFYIGQISAKEPDAVFHIISKDTGFDPLIQHIKTKKIFSSRTKDIKEIPVIEASTSKTPEEKTDVIIVKLQQLKASKPRTTKTLTSTIIALFQKKIPESEVLSLIGDLETQKILTISNNKVSYNLPQ